MVRITRLAVAIIAGAITLIPVRALASCHVAGFTDESVSVSEGAGSVTLTVELQGRQPSCEGTVDYQTQNGSATAPQDYTARSGTLTFQEGDDRVETITIPIVNDTSDEPNQSFQVHIHGPSGGITGVDGPATVTITDNDNPPPPPQQTTPPPSPRRTQTRRATTPPPATQTTPAATQAGFPSVPAVPTATPTGTATGAIAAPAASQDDDSNTGPLIALVLGILGLIAVVVVLLRRTSR